MQRTESKSWSGKNDIVPRTPRFSNHVVKGGMKTTGKGSPAAREPIVNRTRSTSQITADNTVKTTGNGSTNIGEDIMPRIRNGSGKDFVIKSKFLLRGTWCIPELVKAVEVGYHIVHIHKVWHFPEEQRQEGLFADYVNTWLKIKQESAGYPGWAQTDVQKQQYVCDYQAKEGITLDPLLIEKNPGCKATAKLMLNSFWGKFGENLHKKTTEAVTTPAHLFALVSDTFTDIHTVRFCSQDSLKVVYSNLRENQLDNGRVNIFIAAFTTCWARLKLYSYLEQLQQQVLYFDTDSVIFSWKPGQPDIPLGDVLGEMTNELDDGDYIIDFTSAGPKNYGYKTKNGKVCCKVRGFTLNVRGEQQLNYCIMRQNLLEELTDPLDERRNIDVVNPNFFTRHPATKQLKVGPRTKRYGLVFDKRVVDPDTFKSYPYGYKPSSFNDVDMENAETLMEL